MQCETDPPEPPDETTVYDWDLEIRNRSFLHHVTYTCSREGDTFF